MSWFKLDDQFPTHPKVMRAGTDAAWLFVAGGCYCAKHLTDGKIPKAAVSTLTTLRGGVKLAAVLVRENLWHDLGDEYEVHDYLVYNPTREKVENDRRAAAERRTKGGKRSADVRANETNPVPSRPDVLSEHDGSRKRSTRPPSDFEPSEAHRVYADEQGLDVEREAEGWLMDCEAKGRTYKSVNAGFSTWLHRAVEFGRGGKPKTAEIVPALGVLELGRIPEPQPCPLGVPYCDRGMIADPDDPPGAAPRECACRTERARVAHG